jgi:hypothetical protein
MEHQMTLETNFPTSKGWGMLLENQTIRIFPTFRATQATTSINMGQKSCRNAKRYETQGGDWISSSCLLPALALITSSLWPLGHGGAVDLDPRRWEGSAPYFEGFVLRF